MSPSGEGPAERTGVRPPRWLWSSVHTGLLMSVTGASAWISGLPFIFPSLGPSAFMLAVRRRSGDLTAYRVIGGHSVAIVAGMASYHLLATGVDLAGVSPLSDAGLRLAASGVLSVALTSALMLVSGARHAPACATTLIISLGILASPLDGLLILASVVALYSVHVLLRHAEDRLLAREPRGD